MKPFEERNSSSQWEVQSCSQGALVFKFREVGGEVLFSSCIWCGEWTFHASFIGGGGGEGAGFIFLSANRKGQGALLLFLLS
jgi:hypothetical protein